MSQARSRSSSASATFGVMRARCPLASTAPPLLSRVRSPTCAPWFGTTLRYGRPRIVSTGGNMDGRLRRGIALGAGVVLALGTLLAVPAGAHGSPPPQPQPQGDRARYILPP